MLEITLEKLAADVAGHLDRLDADQTELVVTRKDQAPLVVMTLAELESLRETLYLLGEPANAEHLRRSIRSLEGGEGAEHELIRP